MIWIIRKHPEDVPSMLWRATVAGCPTVYTGRSTWRAAMDIAETITREVNQ